MDFLMLERWSPYVVGILIGLLNIGSLLVSKKPLGASTSFMKFGGIIYKSFDKEKVKNNAYYQKNELKLDWGIMLVLGIILGAFVSAMLSGDFNLTAVPDMWSNEVSESFILRFLAAVAGGIFLGVGARWAGGCTSGHGISGTSMLSVISWVAAIAFFIGGIAVAFLIYGM
ncbi:YeeE/YedE thiosulfate transporter family protein [Gudongella sp. DL1XJH-153]|uniref:YeeE/YedE thiosulfate transporter family protein n=1 Tax=Gudongella sp. DL1XJH-153 TaxID=3409804 RepID=UPI003BB5E4AC